MSAVSPVSDDAAPAANVVCAHAPTISTAAVAAQIRAQLDAQITAVDARVRHLVTAAEAYRTAVAGGLLARCLAHNGLPAPAASDADAAVLALLATVEALPELAASVGDAVPRATRPPTVEAATPVAPATSGADVAAPDNDPRDATAYARLRAAAATRGPLVLVGGLAVADKLAWLRRRVPATEWVEAYRQ